MRGQIIIKYHIFEWICKMGKISHIKPGSLSYNEYSSLLKMQFVRELSSEAERTGLCRYTEAATAWWPVNCRSCIFITLLVTSIFSVALFLPLAQESLYFITLLWTPMNELNCFQIVQIIVLCIVKINPVWYFPLFFSIYSSYFASYPGKRCLFCILNNTNINHNNLSIHSFNKTCICNAWCLVMHKSCWANSQILQ